jgi:hypothetical protein
MEDTYTWLYNIIESCNNVFHFDGADVLISLFSDRYRDIDKVSGLRLLRQKKWNSVQEISMESKRMVTTLNSPKIF